MTPGFVIDFSVVLRSGKGAGEERHARGREPSAAGPGTAHQDQDRQESRRTQRRPRRARDAPLQGPGRDGYVPTPARAQGSWPRSRVPVQADGKQGAEPAQKGKWTHVSGPASKRGRSFFSHSKALPLQIIQEPLALAVSLVTQAEVLMKRTKSEHTLSCVSHSIGGCSFRADAAIINTEPNKEQLVAKAAKREAPWN